MTEIIRVMKGGVVKGIVGLYVVYLLAVAPSCGTRRQIDLELWERQDKQTYRYTIIQHTRWPTYTICTIHNKRQYMYHV